MLISYLKNESGADAPDDRQINGRAVDTMAAKYLRLAAELRQLCASLQQQGQIKLPGEQALCDSYHCSRETVRHALELLAEEGLIIRMQGSGTYLSGGPARGRRIVVVASSLDTYLYPQLFRDLERVFSAQGFSVEAYATGNRVMEERGVLERLLSDPPAGILLEGAKTALPSPNLDLLKRIETLHIPLVFLHAGFSVPEAAPCVRDDNAGGAQLLTRYLLGRGHREIAAVLKSDDLQGHERYEGFISTLLKAGCAVREERIFWFDTAQREALINGQDEWLYAFIRQRLPGCTAVLCYNDEIAYPMIRCLRAEGLRVPEDMAVVSFDNSHYCTNGPVAITSLAHERHQMGSTAAEALLNLIRGRSVRSVQLPWSIRERASG